MLTQIEIDENLLQEAMSLTKVNNEKEIIHLALEELIRAILRRQLIDKAGSGFIDMSLKELYKLRMERDLELDALRKAVE
ncbi:MAG: type II toxin-antitoxin system VapB family antitoxin [bacterium]